ncbi:MAG: PAS domain-containing protein [Burkholderiaceae bacterium]|nr:PAS domain-containing protein [Burkholderiaceae bacterium]
MGLQRKLALVSIATAGAALLAALLALFSYDVIVARPRLVSDLAGRMELVSLNLDVDLNFGDQQAATRTLAALRSNPDVRGACLFDARHRLFASYGRSGPMACAWPDDLAVGGHRFHGGSLAMLAPVRYEHEVTGYLQVDYALPSLAERLRQYGLVLSVVLLTLVVGGGLHAVMVRRLVTRPLLALSAVAHRVTLEQRYDLRADAGRQDEVGRLGGAINGMLSTIEAREAALRRSQSLLENIVARSTAVIYIKDMAGLYMLINESFRMILPPGAPDPIGRHDREIFSSEIIDTLLENDRHVLETGAAAAYEESVPDSTGGIRTYISMKFPLLDEHGQIWALGGISTDITDRKRSEVAQMHYRDELEEQVALRTAQMAATNSELADSLEHLRRAQDELVRSEKLAALGSLVAGVAHELNTPIGNSLLAVSTLADQTGEFQRLAEQGLKRSTLQAFVADINDGCDIVLRNLRRAVDLVASFKQVAVDRATSQRRQFQLAELANEILLVLLPSFKKSGIRVRQDVPLDIVMMSYPGPFGQVLINLITNALMHGFEDRSEGDVLLSARMVAPGMVEITVSDNGCGIAPENMGRIYDPFFTTKLGRGGSGLGLNIVYNIVYGVLDGKIEVHSELGSGTHFTLTLPTNFS